MTFNNEIIFTAVMYLPVKQIGNLDSSISQPLFFWCTLPYASYCRTTGCAVQLADTPSPPPATLDLHPYDIVNKLLLISHPAEGRRLSLRENLHPRWSWCYSRQGTSEIRQDQSPTTPTRMPRSLPPQCTSTTSRTTAISCKKKN